MIHRCYSCVIKTLHDRRPYRHLSNLSHVAYLGVFATEHSMVGLGLGGVLLTLAFVDWLAGDKVS